MWDVTEILRGLDLLSAIVFAITGALVASRKELDLVGFLWFGVLTGVGGGTLRDLLLGVPVFWVVDPTPIALCLAASAVLHFTAHVLSSRYRLILWLDAAGMALVAVAGAAKSLDAGVGALVAIVMGVVTASVGGIVRDLLGQEPSIVLRREIYVTAAALGASIFVLVESTFHLREISMASGLVAAFTLRGLALRFDLSLPAYRRRPGRHPDGHGRTDE